MGTHRIFMLKNSFKFVDKAFLAGFVYRFCNSFLGLVWKLICNMFELITSHFSGSKPQEHKDEPFILDNTSRDLNFDGLIEEENSKLTFRFNLLSDEVLRKSCEKGTGDSVSVVSDLSISQSKYQFVSERDLCGYIEGIETASFTVQESFVGSDEDFVQEIVKPHKKFCDDVEEIVNSPVEIMDHGKMGFLNCDQDYDKNGDVSEAEDDVVDDQMEKVVADGKTGDFVDRDENEVLDGQKFSESEQVNWLGEFFQRRDYGDWFSPEVVLGSGKSEAELYDSGGAISTRPTKVEFDDHGFFTSGGGIGKLECESPIIRPNGSMERANVSPRSTILESSDESSDKFSNSPRDDMTNNELSSESAGESGKEEDLNEPENNHLKENDARDDLRKLEQDDREEKNSWEFYYDEDEDEDDDDDLIERLKMEMKSVRKVEVLPTILEECEIDKLADDLQPLSKFDVKMEHKDRMGEIQKVYNRYTERMKKLDILNFQTLQALNFLHSKQSENLSSSENYPFMAIKSILLPNSWPCKLRKIYADPVLKSMAELQRDLEVVYVGQTSLSWEILHWQYTKAKEFQEVDASENQSYNLIAGEFQQFQVLLQRFTEDEPFQEPRVQHYAKNRCMLRSLLQVPTIKDDPLMGEKVSRDQLEGVITMAVLAERLKESMIAFWEFLRADKDNSSLILSKVLQGSRSYLQDPADYELLLDVKSRLQKKQKRLKDIVRTGNCLVKKFQKHHEPQLDHHAFVTQVELKLVQRVLSLSRLTRDQLVWCQAKLNTIIFHNRKIRVEPSFLLFPC